MSDTIDAAAPPSTESASQHALTSATEASVHLLRPCDLTRLAQGFYFIFWGSLAVLSTMADLWVSLAVLATVAEGPAAPTLWVYPLVVGGAGVLGMLAGSWRLCQTKDLGRDWKHCTRGLLIMAMLIAYLFLFFCMWLRLPTNLYMLYHALAWVALLICHLSLLSAAVGVLARLTGRSSLAMQALLYGGGVFIVLFAPFALLARSLVIVTWRRGNPLVALQFLLGNIQSAYLLVALIPLALTLSLAWTAKDIALRQLTTRES